MFSASPHSFFHFPERIRGRKKEIRTIQSTTMAIQTPVAPQPRSTHKIQDKPTRAISMDAIPTRMVNCTSLAARRALGSVKDMGQNSMPNPLWIQISRKARSAVSGDKEL